MRGENYIPQAKTPEEHLNNCQFQGLNVEGWLNWPDGRDLAALKARCLLESAELLVAAFEAEARKGKS